jgi:hypothetical protein
MVVDAAIEAAPVAIEPEPAAVEIADAPIAFEADAEIAFEAAADFEFEAMHDVALESEPAPMAAEPYAIAAAPVSEPEPEPEPASMFDSTYVQPAEEQAAAVSQFFVTPPAPVHSESASSMFDARPSEAYGGGAPEVAAAAPVEAEAEAIEFASEVAFEPEDAVVFESVFEDEGLGALTVAEPPALPPALALDVVESADPMDAAEIAAVPDAASTSEPLSPVEIASAAELLDAVEPTEPIDNAEGLDAPSDLPVPAAGPDDRTLVQFSATVPHDLAELRRIAADNQW